MDCIGSLPRERANEEVQIIRQARATETRSSLILSAARAFEQRGYSATSTNDILQEAGVTKGALYFHFASKEDLAVAVTQEQFGLWPSVVAEELVRCQTPLDALLAVYERVCDRFQNDVLVRAGVRLSFERDLISADMPVPFVGWEQLLSGLLEQALAAGQLREDVVPETEARIIVAAFFGIQHRSGVLADRADLPRRLVEFWCRYLPAISCDEEFNARVAAQAKKKSKPRRRRQPGISAGAR